MSYPSSKAFLSLGVIVSEPYSKPLLAFMAQVQEDLELQDSLKAIISAGSGASALVALGKQKGHSFTEEEVLDFEGVARSWSEPSYPSSLSEEERSLLPPPPGVYELDDELLANAVGGARGFSPRRQLKHLSRRGNEKEPPRTGSEGHVCTVSGECSPGGGSCWPF